MMNENAISNVLIDVDFIEGELQSTGRQHLCVVFNELRSVRWMCTAQFTQDLTSIC